MSLIIIIARPKVIYSVQQDIIVSSPGKMSIDSNITIANNNRENANILMPSVPYYLANKIMENIISVVENRDTYIEVKYLMYIICIYFVFAIRFEL